MPYAFLHLPITAVISLLIILGLIIGSFLNVIIIRLPSTQSLSIILTHPSQCTHCNKKLYFYDLGKVLE